MWEIISQIIIAVFSTLALILIAKKNKWGFVFGLLQQPFWFITTFNNHQWGLFILSFVYTGTWGFGFYEWFFKKDKTSKNETKER